jgi:hypothetical protein
MQLLNMSSHSIITGAMLLHLALALWRLAEYTTPFKGMTHQALVLRCSPMRLQTSPSLYQLQGLPFLNRVQRQRATMRSTVRQVPLPQLLTWAPTLNSLPETLDKKLTLLWSKRDNTNITMDVMQAWQVPVPPPLAVCMLRTVTAGPRLDLLPTL